MSSIRLQLLILYIFLCTIYFTNGQNVITKPPEGSCLPSTTTLNCPANYAIVVRNAAYGVAQTVGACSYQVGDCTADAMNIISCNTDSLACGIYATKKKLAECNDQDADYIHIEYDCVPISMDDPSKEYHICQNSTDITTDHGIIISPGYPTQFQATTSECFRAIHVPDDKNIRLWLSDLSIGSTITNCADDHLYVVDSIQTYKHCGLRRLAYPYLCSSTILIQYLITNVYPNYRGVRMYFEIVDRPANDGCPNPNATITPVPATTTTITTIEPATTTPIPVYVLLGISSPVRSVQLCQGDSYTFECPNNYVVTIIRNMYGVPTSGQCEPHDAANHCVVSMEPTIMCRQSCVYIYSGHQTIPSCNNQIATYQYIEYQCIPTNTEIVSNSTCPSDGSSVSISIDHRGRFQSHGYPNLQTMNCTYRITTHPGFIMHFYALDISLNSFQPMCQSNKITIIDKDSSQPFEICEQRAYRLIYSTCSNQIDLIYTIANSAQSFSSGAELYIESQHRPLDWPCGQPLPTSSPVPTNPSTLFTTPTATPLSNQTYVNALPEVEHDICYGTAMSYTCPLGYTFMIVGAFYGVRSDSLTKCGYVQGDCTQDAIATITQCRNDVPNCYLSYSYEYRLAYCSDNYADYLHVTSQCVPSASVSNGTAIQTYDICDTTNDIRDIHGLVTSPSFPYFQPAVNECKRKIINVQDRVLKIWVNEIALSSGGQRNAKDLDNSNSNEPDLVLYKPSNVENFDDIEQLFPSVRDTCINDYLMINTPHVAYIFCGTRKLVLQPICAQSVDIHYKATSPASIFYKGFKFYFEWVPKPAEIICGGTPPTGSTTTTPVDDPLPLWAQNLELSPVLSEHICLGTSTTLRCPRGSDYVLSIIEATYGVSGSGFCEIPTSSHCRQEASLGLTCTQSCFIEYILPKPLTQCSSQNADYLNIDYECIPTRLPNHENPIDICASTPTDTIAIDTGMMVSPQYPSLNGPHSCSKKIQTLSSKLWMVFIVDLFLEGTNLAGQCDASSLTIYDGTDKIIRCGLQQPQLVLISCSDIIEFQYISTHNAIGYRGFKVYFKTIDVPQGWACKPTGYTTPITTTTPYLPVTTSRLPPSAQIVAYGGTTNGTRRYCTLPFVYQGKEEAVCSRADPPSTPASQTTKEPWCSLTYNFDTDGQWGFCDLGVTDTTMHDLCRSTAETITCPSGYVIDILTADYAAKPDGSTDPSSCIYSAGDCFQSDAPTIQASCAGQSSCYVYHSSRPLTSCQNRPSSYLHISYTCVPNDIAEITQYDMCNGDPILPDDTRRGFIISPNFPNTPNNLDCTLNLRTVKSHQDIYLYIVKMDLNGPNATGENCLKDRLLVTADNTMNEMCGLHYTNLLVYTCHESVSLRLIRSSDAEGNGVKFYFEFRDKPVFQLCPSLPSTTTVVTLSPTPSTTTTEGPLPSYYPNPSPRMLKSLCHPDLSGLMDAKNFQCPSNYVIVIHRAFYGKGSRCDYTSGDCIAEADIVYRTCAGKQACSVSFINVVLLPECNNAMANYLFVEYQCLPTTSIAPTVGDVCTTSIDPSGTSGVLTSLSYPSYTSTQCSNATLSTMVGSNLVIYMYLLDFNIGSANGTGQCTNDYLSLSYQCHNQLYNQRLCGTHHTQLLLSTCEPTDKIFVSYSLFGQDPQAHRGFALLYHLLPPSEATSIEPVTSDIPTSPTPPGTGPLSTPVERIIACDPHPVVIECNITDYVLVLHKAELGVSATNSCSYSPNDCFEDRTHAYNYCGGRTLCDIFPPPIPISQCNNLRAHYLHVEYQCIPKRPKLNLDICSTPPTIQRVTGGAIVSSLNYTAENKKCKAILRADKVLGPGAHKAFKIYILSLNLPMRASMAREQGAQCSDLDPIIEIDDHELPVTRLCGNSHTRYLLETCSTLVEVRFNNTIMPTESVEYSGFEIYFESIGNNECRTTVAPPIQTQPFVVTSHAACALATGHERVDFTCPPDYGLVFLQSYQMITIEPDKCNVSQHICSFPSEQPQAQCSGQQGCSYTHITESLPISSVCQDKQPDSVEFYYQCLPMRPSIDFPKYAFCADQTVTGEYGFIESPYFPMTYQNQLHNCSLTIQIPENNDNKTYAIYLYIMEFSIRDTSAINASSSPIQCFDSIEYTDGNVTRSLCGKFDQPLLEYHTYNKNLNLTLTTLHTTAIIEANNWQGARFFFYIGDLSLPLPPTAVTTVPPITTTKVDQTSPKPGLDEAGLVALIVVVCVLALSAVAIAFVYYRRRKQEQGPKVVYHSNMETIEGTVENDEKDRRTSIPADSLKGPATSFPNPAYKKLEIDGQQDAENTTDA